jgi:hypothetical protein
MNGQDFTQEMSAQWYYGQVGEQLGPVSGQELNAKLRNKEVAPTVLVWREGMPQWAPVTSVPALIQGVKLYSWQIADPEVHRQRKIVSNAKQNSVAMFVVFLLFLMTLMAQVTIAMSGKKAGDGGCIGTAGILGGIYAVIYLPLRWRTIWQLPSSFRVMGLIGGFGLIALLALLVAVIAASIVFHLRF